MLRSILFASCVLVLSSAQRVAAQAQLVAQARTNSGYARGAVTGDSAIQSHQVRVAADNDEWTATGLYLNLGDCMMIFTSPGKVKIGAASGEVDANGFSSGQGQLKGKVGMGSSFAVGSRQTFCSDQKGTLKLRISDNRYEDNSGEFTVMLIRVPAQFIPEPQPYSSED